MEVEEGGDKIFGLDKCMSAWTLQMRLLGILGNHRNLVCWPILLFRSDLQPLIQDFGAD